MINYDVLAIEVANALLEGKLSFQQISAKYGLKYEDVEVIWSGVCEQLGEDDYD